MAEQTPSYLPVIRTITRPDGSSFEPCDELRIKSGLTYTVVTGDGPDRGELDVYVAPVTTLPFTVPVVQPPVAAGESGSGGSTRTILAFASTEASSHITGAALFAGGALTANNTNYGTATLWETDETGAHVGSALYTADTRISGGTNPTGTWSAGSMVIDAGLGIDIGAGHALVSEWKTDNGAGVDMPGGWWRIT